MVGLVKRRIDGVKVFGIQMILRNAKSIAEALVVNDFPLSEEFDGIPNVGVVTQAQNVVIGGTRLLLCYDHVFATFFDFQKPRKTLIFQGLSALFESVCYLRLPCVKGADAEGG